MSDRFWEKVNRTDTCWLWIAYRDELGYGKVRWAGRIQVAHRVAYELVVGPILEGLTLDHLCRNRGCVNPAHLEPVSLGENILRGNTFQAVNAAKTSCPQGHPYDSENTYWHKATSRYPSGRRECRICRAASRRAARIRAKAVSVHGS